MALTRKFLSALGIEAEKIDEIITAHTDTVNGLKNEIEKYKGDAELLPSVQKDLNKAKKDLEALSKDGYEQKYKDLQTEFNNYKTEQANKETIANKSKAYKELLKASGISEKRHGGILKVTNLDDMELNEDGSLKNADKLTENIKSEWSDFIVNESVRGADTQKPPTNMGGAKTKDEIYRKDDNGRYVLSASERQSALVELNSSNGAE